MKKQDEEPIRQLLTEGLEEWDRIHETSAPSLQQLEQFVQAAKRDSRRKLISDLLLFWLCAAFLLSGVAAVMAYSASLLLVLQPVALLLLCLPLLVGAVKRGIASREGGVGE